LVGGLAVGVAEVGEGDSEGGEGDTDDECEKGGGG